MGIDFLVVLRNLSWCACAQSQLLARTREVIASTKKLKGRKHELYSYTHIISVRAFESLKNDLELKGLILRLKPSRKHLFKMQKLAICTSSFFDFTKN